MPRYSDVYWTRAELLALTRLTRFERLDEPPGVAYSVLADLLDAEGFRRRSTRSLGATFRALRLPGSSLAARVRRAEVAELLGLAPSDLPLSAETEARLLGESPGGGVPARTVPPLRLGFVRERVDGLLDLFRDAGGSPGVEGLVEDLRVGLEALREELDRGASEVESEPTGGGEAGDLGDYFLVPGEVFADYRPLSRAEALEALRIRGGEPPLPALLRRVPYALSVRVELERE